MQKSTSSPVKPPPRTLEGKIALVTGGSRGIGKAICLELARRGARVAFTYFRKSNEAQAVEVALTEIGAQPVKIKANLADRSEQTITALIETVKQSLGDLDILINNAASGVMRTPSDTSSKHWDWTLGINAKAPWLLCIKAAEIMREGSKVVNVSSPGSSKVLPPYFSVGVSKAALEAVSRYLAIDLGAKGIVVNTLAAGFVMTDAIDAFPEDWAVKQLAERPTPAGRPVLPEDVAAAVAMLCSEDANMIRGQLLLVDGGESLLYR